MSAAAQWIWMPGQHKAINAYIQFRRMLVLPADATDICLHICSNEHYRLFINGRWIKDGPARFEKPHPYRDSLKQQHLKLKAGQSNCIAIQCVQTGLAQHACALVPGGLHVDLSYRSGGRLRHLRADRQWRCRLAPEFQRHAPRKFFALQFNEYIDAAQHDAWIKNNFDDSGWQRAERVDHRGLRQLEDRPIPFIKVTTKYPVRLRRYEQIPGYNGVYGLHWDYIDLIPPHKEARFETWIYSARDCSCSLQVACDNYARFSIDDQDIIVQGEADNGFVNHLETERAGYKGMHHGHGLRHEGSGSRPSSAEQQMLRLSKGWHKISVWVWRPRSCNGFSLCLMNKQGRPLALPCSAQQLRTDINTWALVKNNAHTPIAATVSDLRPFLEVAHLNDWLPHQLVKKPAHKALLQGGSFTLKADHAVDLDLGGNFSGYIALDVKGPDGALLDICVGEAQTELHDGALRACYNGMWQGDRIICSGRRFHWFSAQRKAGRYLKLIARNADVSIKQLKLYAWSYPVSSYGSFSCNDTIFNWMWRAGARSVNDASFDVGEDCPTREQGQWTGDMYLRAHQIAWLWGDLRLSAKALRETAHDQPRNNWARPICPSGYGDKLVDYCPLLPIWAVEHYAYTADTSVLRDCWQGISNLFTHAESLRDRYGMYQPGDHARNILYIDYSMKPYPRCGDTTTHLQVLMYTAYRHAASAAEILGKKKIAQQYRKHAATILHDIQRYLWDAQKGLFVDGIRNGRAGDTFSAATNYYALWAGVCNAEQEQRILENLWHTASRENMDYWERGESPFTKFFAARALLERGYWRQAFSMWRGYYKNMAKHPEAYTCIEWWQRNMSPHKVISRSSLVHPFAMGSMADFAHAVCGLQPARSGFKALCWKPIPGDLKNFDAAFPLGDSGHQVEVLLRSKGKQRSLTLIKDADLDVTMDDRFLGPHDRMLVKNR